MRLKLSYAHLSCAGFAIASLLSFPAARAQSAGSPAALATPSVRITAPVVNESLVTLKGNTHPMAQARYDQGAASTSLATGKLQLLLKRSPAQQAALREYLGGLADPHSANYRKFLTPQAYGASPTRTSRRLKRGCRARALRSNRSRPAATSSSSPATPARSPRPSTPASIPMSSTESTTTATRATRRSPRRSRPWSPASRP